MTAPDAFPWLVGIAAAAGGLVLGLVYFHLLRRTVDLLIQPGRRRLAIILTLGRVTAAVLLLGLAAAVGGAIPLLAAFGGFLVARRIVLRAARDDAAPAGAPETGPATRLSAPNREVP